MRYFLLRFFFFILCTTPSWAVDFHVPLDCDYGKDCFIEYYFDHEKAEDKAVDYSCGHLTRDGQTSTDFKLRNHQQMAEGVNVLAADDGIVKYVRSNVMDINVNLIGKESISGKECGNGIIIEHKRGYFSQYCHLAQGSITVKVNEEVKRGQKIGQVGLSGDTSFPHLQFTVIKDKTPIDPFTGEDPATESSYTACGSLDIYPLWDRKTEKYLRYITTALLNTGFTSRVPHASGAREGKFSRATLKDNSKFLVFWVDILGIEQNDELKLTIVGPDGSIVSSKNKIFDEHKRHFFDFVAKRTETGKKLQAGEYMGHIELIRNEAALKQTVIDYTTTTTVIKHTSPK